MSLTDSLSFFPSHNVWLSLSYSLNLSLLYSFSPSVTVSRYLSQSLDVVSNYLTRSFSVSLTVLIPFAVSLTLPDLALTCYLTSLLSLTRCR